MRAVVSRNHVYNIVRRLPFRMETIVTRDSAKVRRENSSGRNVHAHMTIFLMIHVTRLYYTNGRLQYEGIKFKL